MLFPLECIEDEAQPTDQNAKQSKTDSMDRITETNYKAQERTLDKQLFMLKGKLKQCLLITCGVTLFS